jgi:hypothetical protein
VENIGAQGQALISNFSYAGIMLCDDVEGRQKVCRSNFFFSNFVNSCEFMEMISVIKLQKKQLCVPVLLHCFCVLPVG